MDTHLAHLILANRQIAYALTDRELMVTQVSGSLPLGVGPHSDWVGHSLLDLVPELVGSEKALAEILDGQADHLRLLLVNRETAEGATVYMTMEVLPHPDLSGQIMGLVYLVQDATEWGLSALQVTQHRNELGLLREQLEHQNQVLKASNAELQQLSALKSQFVSIAAHELRTPLTTLYGYLDLLLMEDFGRLNEQQRRFLEIVRNGAHHLTKITHDLLDTSQIEAGQVELLLKPENLQALLETVAAELKPQIDAKQQRLTVHAADDLPLALCDDMRIVQVGTNLMSNASKYTPEGGTIDVFITLAAEEGFLQVAVTDTGVGIGPEDQAKLFTRFFRAKTASLTGASGTGLGLHITRNLVELHGGRIWFESELNRGSTFYFTLPVADDLLSSWSNPDEFSREI
ncbi:MAG: PAS domain-containing protein [Anaerolineaceae bacterium]|nr:PAS domain-containing protein [Anaerolineaceae bacterium]MCB9102516.1 PAS domain-containing protein [Anaerolineales bacterium]